MDTLDMGGQIIKICQDLNKSYTKVIHVINRAMHLLDKRVSKHGNSKVINIPSPYVVDYAIQEGDSVMMSIENDNGRVDLRDQKIKKAKRKTGNHHYYLTLPAYKVRPLSLDIGDNISVSLKPESDSITSKEELEERGMGWPEGNTAVMDNGDTRFLGYKQAGYKLKALT